jgi:hypothetical protein
MVGQTSCLSVQARCLHHPIHKRYFSNSHIPNYSAHTVYGHHPALDSGFRRNGVSYHVASKSVIPAKAGIQSELFSGELSS